MEVNGKLHAPVVLTLGKNPAGANYTGGWVGPRAGLDDVEQRKISCPWRESNNCAHRLHERYSKPQNHWVSGLRLSSGILDTRKHNVSETGSVSGHCFIASILLLLGIHRWNGHAFTTLPTQRNVVPEPSVMVLRVTTRWGLGGICCIYCLGFSQMLVMV
jgi:hypothetical protein